MAGYTMLMWEGTLTNGESVWGASCPAIPGLHVQEDTRAQVIETSADLMAILLEMMAERGTVPLVETPELLAEAVRDELEWRAEEGLASNLELVVVEPALAVAAA